MTRPSRRDLERTVDDLADNDGKDWSAPLTDQEKQAAGDSVDVERWDRTAKRREVFRALTRFAEEARAA